MRRSRQQLRRHQQTVIQEQEQQHNQDINSKNLPLVSDIQGILVIHPRTDLDREISQYVESDNEKQNCLDRIKQLLHPIGHVSVIHQQQVGKHTQAGEQDHV